jgi:gamma-glutamyltranspeptidase/glutathione hydrolase
MNSMSRLTIGFYSCLLLPFAVFAGSTSIAQKSVSATEYMVASANPYASKVGLHVLAQGGTAIDAAVAVQLMLNLVEQES